MSMWHIMQLDLHDVQQLLDSEERWGTDLSETKSKQILDTNIT